MALFYGIRANALKAKAATFVQNLLEMQSRGGLYNGPPPGKVANRLVQATWDKNGGYFGEGRPLPNPFILAAAAFSAGINSMNSVGDRSGELSMLFGLGEVLLEIQKRDSAGQMSLHVIDRAILDQTVRHYEHVSSVLGQTSVLDAMNDFEHGAGRPILGKTDS